MHGYRYHPGGGFPGDAPGYHAELPGAGPEQWIGTAIATAGGIAKQVIGGGGGGGDGRIIHGYQALNGEHKPGPFTVQGVEAALRAAPRDVRDALARTVAQENCEFNGSCGPDGRRVDLTPGPQMDDTTLARCAVYLAHGAGDAELNREETLVRDQVKKLLSGTTPLSSRRPPTEVGPQVPEGEDPWEIIKRIAGNLGGVAEETVRATAESGLRGGVAASEGARVGSKAGGVAGIPPGLLLAGAGLAAVFFLRR